MNINLENKVVVITGSSRGIGKRLSIAFAQEKAKVVLNYCKSRNEALNHFNSINKINNCILMKADISKTDQVNRLFKDTIDKFGKIDVLINNAGIINDADLFEMTDESWNKVIQTNLTGTFKCCREYVRYARFQGGGKIINVGSHTGMVGRKKQINYASSKSALIGFTKTLAEEVATYNISTNLVCPGFIETDMNRYNKFKSEYAQQHNLLSIEHTYNDFEKFVLFLASDSVLGVSGQIFILDSRK